MVRIVAVVVPSIALLVFQPIADDPFHTDMRGYTHLSILWHFTVSWLYVMVYGYTRNFVYVIIVPHIVTPTLPTMCRHHLLKVR